VGQSAAASGVKFRPRPSSALGEKVASGLVWRFGTFDCIDDNLTYFKNGPGDNGSFLDVGSHRFYVAKPFLKEVPMCLTLSVMQTPKTAKAVTFAAWLKCWPWRRMVAVAHRAPRAHRSNAHLHRNMVFHLQSGTCWTQPSRTCALHSTSPRIRSRSPRIWSGRVSTSSRKRSMSMTHVGVSSP
jgi:hypothetical protein